MKEDKVKLSILIPKEVVDKIDEGKEKECLSNRSVYINQILRRYFGFPSVLDSHYVSIKRKDNFSIRNKNGNKNK